MRLISGTGIFLTYLAPCLLVTTLMLWEYYDRICASDNNMNEYAPMVLLLDEASGGQHDDGEDQFVVDGHLSKVERKEIVRRFNRVRREYNNAPNKKEWLNKFKSEKLPEDFCKKIWRENSIIIAIMVFLPFLLFALRLGYDNRIECGTRERFSLAFENWPMKLIVAGVIGVGWMYLLNPYGRAATAFFQAYLLYSIPPINTLPTYISVPDISHTVAGFLGWYLNFLFYAFTKLYHNDVTSSRMYRFLFVKLLFTYGLALVATPVFETEGKLAMFLIGFFPVSAVSTLKRIASKTMQGVEADSDNLSILPGMSNWTLLRLQEEGVNGVTTLATLRIEEIKKYFPVRIANLLRLWIDAARLHTAVGAVAYQKLQPLCRTASEFKALAEKGDFQDALKKATGIESAQTVVERLDKTFSDDLFAEDNPPTASESPSRASS